MNKNSETLDIGQAELNLNYHPDDIESIHSLQSFCPDYFKIIQEFGLGKIWQRPALSSREKECIVLASLITQGDCEVQLRQHVFTAQQRGLAVNDILESIILLTVYIGVPRTLNAIEVVRRVLAERK